MKMLFVLFSVLKIYLLIILTKDKCTYLEPNEFL